MPPLSSAVPRPTRRAPAAPSAHSVRWALALNPVRFLAVGCAGLSLDAGSFLALAAMGTPEPFARALSLGAATLLTWRLNRRFTFGDSDRRESFEGGCYTAVALGAQGLNYALFLMLRALWPALPPLLALFAGAVFAAGFSYTGQRFFTFRGRIRS